MMQNQDSLKNCAWCQEQYTSKYCPDCMEALWSRVNEIATRLTVNFADAKEYAPWFIDANADNFKLTTLNRAIEHLKESGLSVADDIDQWHMQANIVLSAPYMDL